MNTVDHFRPLIDLPAVLMVLCAMAIVFVPTIQGMIRFYQWQSGLLAVLTILAALFEPNAGGVEARIVLGLFALAIPLLLAFTIEPILALATLRDNISSWQRLRLAVGMAFRNLRFWRLPSKQGSEPALPVWLEHSISPSRQLISAAVSIVITAIAFSVAFDLSSADTFTALHLALALTLLMLGIFTMINREDLISHIIGLLVMDHGLFLAVVRVINWFAYVPLLVLSLFLYILITFVILLILLPELHQASGTIEVAGQNTLTG